MSNVTGGTDGGSFSSENVSEDARNKHPHPELLNRLHSSNSSTTTNSNGSHSSQQQAPPPAKKKRSLPGTPDPSAEVVALSPNTLMATNRFVCEICHKGFQRDQNLQLHRRGHNLPWKLKQRTSTEVRKRVYVCPEPSCVHHNPARALGDLTGIKKHFSRKHGEKKWKCDKCSKKYAVQSDWKAHLKTCGTREYKCDCGTIFSRRDSFITHRAFCDALAEENSKTQQLSPLGSNLQGQPAVSSLLSSLPISSNHNTPMPATEFNQSDHKSTLLSLPHHDHLMPQMSTRPMHMLGRSFSSSASPSLQLSSNAMSILEGHGQHLAGTALMSATALLQKAAQMGSSVSSTGTGLNSEKGFATSMAPSTFGALQQPNCQQMLMDPLMSNGEQDHVNGNASHSFNNNWAVGNAEMGNMAMYGALVDEGNPLSKNMEDNSRKSRSVLQGATQSVGLGQGTNNGGDTMTLDFLGVGGGGSRHGNSYSQQQQKRQQMGFEGLSQSGLQGLNQLQQRAAFEKGIWQIRE